MASSSSFPSSPSPPPTHGLLFIPSHPTTISEELYNRFYNDEHLPDVLAHDLTRVVVRYQKFDRADTTADTDRGPGESAEEKKEARFLALCPVEDVRGLIASPKIPAFARSSRRSRVLQTEDVEAMVRFEVWPYVKTQTFGTSGGRGKTLVCGFVEPREGGEEDLEGWYREEHLGLLRERVRDYRRSTRYVRTDGVEPRFLAVHEYDCEPGELPTEEIGECLGTEWARRIVGEAKISERSVWG